MEKKFSKITPYLIHKLKRLEWQLKPKVYSTNTPTPRSQAPRRHGPSRPGAVIANLSSHAWSLHHFVQQAGSIHHSSFFLQTLFSRCL